MAFQIARAIFTLAIRLIHGFAINARAGGASPLVVRIDIIDMDKVDIEDVLMVGGLIPPGACQILRS